MIRIRQLWIPIAASAAMLLTGGTAHAQSVEFLATSAGRAPVSAFSSPSASSSGKGFKVSLQKNETSSNAWNVNVKAADGNAGGDGVKIAITLNSSKGSITINLNESQGMVTPVSGSPVDSSSWTAGGNIAFNASSQDSVLKGDGSTEFLGKLVQLDLTNPAVSVHVDIFASNGTVYQGGGSIPPSTNPPSAVPEPASLALALPGLLPLGLALQRRRRSGKAPPELSG